MRAQFGVFRIGLGTLLVFESGCAAAHSRSCAQMGDQTLVYHVAFSKLSRDCWSGAAPELPAEFSVSPDTAIVANTGKLMTIADVVAKNCSAHLTLSTTSSTGDQVTVNGTALEVRDDGSLHGAGSLELHKADGSSCSASLTVDLTPFGRDAGF